MKTSNSTITAIATPEGIGALAIIRISGPETFDIFERSILEKEKFKKQKEKNISIFTIAKKNEIIDEITAIKYKEPKSFTGEDMIEIICHGGKISKNEIIRILKDNGARIAQRGEFTKRAFENGKMDLIKAESIRGIIESENIIENKNSLKAYYGKTLNIIENLREKILDISSDIESEIEFEEEDDIKNANKNKSKIIYLKNYLEEELVKFKRIKEIGKGIKVLIAGPPNAGKSTLYNKILGYERSIINEEAGTTRDIITEYLEINKKKITIIDSAGIRTTENVIEKEGIKRSEKELENATLIIWITAADEKESIEEIKKIREIKNKRTIFIINKTDKKENYKEEFLKKENVRFLKTSLFNDKIEEIEEEIEKEIKDIINTIDINDFIINERQEEIIEAILENIEKTINNWSNKEIAAIFINKAIEKIENITGKVSKEEVINKIFDKFCIGK